MTFASLETFGKCPGFLAFYRPESVHSRGGTLYVDDAARNKTMHHLRFRKSTIHATANTMQESWHTAAQQRGVGGIAQLRGYMLTR